MSTDARGSDVDRSVADLRAAANALVSIPGAQALAARLNALAGTLPLRDTQQAVIQAAERYADHADRLGNVPCLPDCPSRLRLIAAVAALRAVGAGEEQK